MSIVAGIGLIIFFGALAIAAIGGFFRFMTSAPLVFFLLILAVPIAYFVVKGHYEERERRENERDYAWRMEEKAAEEERQLLLTTGSSLERIPPSVLAEEPVKDLDIMDGSWEFFCNAITREQARSSRAFAFTQRSRLYEGNSSYIFNALRRPSTGRPSERIGRHGLRRGDLLVICSPVESHARQVVDHIFVAPVDSWTPHGITDAKGVRVVFVTRAPGMNTRSAQVTVESLGGEFHLVDADSLRLM